MRVFCLNYHYSNYVFRINDTNRRAYVPIRHMATAMVNAGGARGFGTAYAETSHKWMAHKVFAMAGKQHRNLADRMGKHLLRENSRGLSSQSADADPVLPLAGAGDDGEGPLKITLSGAKTVLSDEKKACDEIISLTCLFELLLFE